jgi:hypothetical protein
MQLTEHGTLVDWTWHEIHTTGQVLGCAGHSLNAMTINGVDYLVAFGGYNGYYLNAVQLLNLSAYYQSDLLCNKIMQVTFDAHFIAVIL